MDEEQRELTELLNRARAGDAEAGRLVFPAVYRQLKKLASARLARIPPGATLQTTALVHEAWMRIAEKHPEGWGGDAALLLHGGARHA